MFFQKHRQNIVQTMHLTMLIAHPYQEESGDKDYRDFMMRTRDRVQSTKKRTKFLSGSTLIMNEGDLFGFPFEELDYDEVTCNR